MQKNCPICGAETKKSVQIFDDRYGYPGLYQMSRCALCHHSRLDVEFSPGELSNLYSNFYPRSLFDLESFQPHQEITGFKSWLNGLKSSAFRWVPKNIRVLDVGCGFGQSLAYHVSRGCDVYGVEADENIRRVIEKYGFKVNVGLFDDAIYPPDFFDYVTMDQVIEHVVDPASTLLGVARILKSGGTAILSTPNALGWGSKVFGNCWINWHAPYHLNFFSKASMKFAAESAGLVLSKVHTTTNSDWLLFQWIHLFTFPKIGKPSPFWKPGQKLTLAQSTWIRLMYLIHKTKLNHLVTRLFDGLGIGDNYIFVLKKP